MNDELDQEWEAKLMQYANELPSEQLPSSMLEERTVRELRARGLLRKKRILPLTWLAGSVAASLALFATGVVVGQYLGTRSTVQMFAQKDAAAQVQQTGSAYVQALEQLVSVAQRNRGSARDSSQAREVALTALHEAANQVARIAPNDPVTAKILQGMQQEQKQSDKRSGRPAQHNVVWF